MKKFLSFGFAAVVAVVASTLFAQGVFASGCFHDPVYDRDWNAEVTTGAFVRDVACMEGSVVMTTIPVGEVIHVIAETDGWYKIERNDGTIGWVGQWLIAPTSKSFVAEIPDVPDVPEYQEPMYDIYGHLYENAIWFIYENGIVGGYPDGSYQADTSVNRAELLKIIVEAVYEDEFEKYSSDTCFNDVPAGEWFTKYVCFAKDNGIVEGYAGNLFKPSQEISFVEALKITMVGFGYDYEGDPWGGPWYFGIVNEASENNFIPLDVEKFYESFTRGQMAELITRVMKFESGELEDYLGEDFDEKIMYDDLR